MSYDFIFEGRHCRNRKREEEWMREGPARAMEIVLQLLKVLVSALFFSLALKPNKPFRQQSFHLQVKEQTRNSIHLSSGRRVACEGRIARPETRGWTWEWTQGTNNREMRRRSSRREGRDWNRGHGVLCESKFQIVIFIRIFFVICNNLIQNELNSEKGQTKREREREKNLMRSEPKIEKSIFQRSRAPIPPNPFTNCAPEMTQKNSSRIAVGSKREHRKNCPKKQNEREEQIENLVVIC